MPTYKDSVFYTYQKLIQLRKEHPLVVWGTFLLIQETADEVFAYIREYEDEKWLVVANFSEKENGFSFDCKVKEVMMQNYGGELNRLDHMILRPYEAFLVKR